MLLRSFSAVPCTFDRPGLEKASARQQHIASERERREAACDVESRSSKCSKYKGTLYPFFEAKRPVGSRMHNRSNSRRRRARDKDERMRGKRSSITSWQLCHSPTTEQGQLFLLSSFFLAQFENDSQDAHFDMINSKDGRYSVDRSCFEPVESNTREDC